MLFVERKEHQKMQDIRSILSLAVEKVVSGDFQAAISYYESAFNQSQQCNWIGGIFCSSKRLGDIYYILVRVKHEYDDVGICGAFDKLVQMFVWIDHG